MFGFRSGSLPSAWTEVPSTKIEIVTSKMRYGNIDFFSYDFVLRKILRG